MKKVIAACVRAEDLAIIQRMSSNHEVVAVVFDLGERAGMRELHDQAVAAGAARCHVLDIRDEYIRACILPVLSAVEGPAMDDGLMSERARTFMAHKLGEIASLEGDCRVMEPAAPAGHSARRLHGAVDCSAVVSIAFEDRIPIAINDIPMTLTEIVDCLTTLGNVHGLVQAQPAISILQAANRQLEDRSSGVARLELRAGNIRTCNDAVATT